MNNTRMDSTRSNSNKSERPVVVLAGWLGCQPRNLRRYKELYENLGWEVIIKIATPPMVVLASIVRPSPITKEEYGLCIDTPNDNKNDHHQIRIMKAEYSMTDVAINILRQIMTLDCPIFIVHVFSNGGCFLWEKIRQILYTRTIQTTNSTIHENDIYYIVDKIRNKLGGVVFDSSPASFANNPNLIFNAMKYSPFLERWKLYSYMFARKKVLGDKKESIIRLTRANDYWCGMRNCISNVPQLYIYSQNDHLTPFHPLDELVYHRQRELGNDIIHSLKFQDSPHCSHLRSHPKEYTEAIQSFIHKCYNNSSSQSRISIQSRL